LALEERKSKQGKKKKKRKVASPFLVKVLVCSD
jgi:hypothetical protein